MDSGFGAGRRGVLGLIEKLVNLSPVDDFFRDRPDLDPLLSVLHISYQERHRDDHDIRRSERTEQEVRPDAERSYVQEKMESIGPVT